MISVAIVGTAGRGPDLNLLLDSKGFYEAMIKKARNCILAFSQLLGDPEVELVSGGAAWADHIAVLLFLESVHRPPHHEDVGVRALKLHLPCPLEQEGFFDSKARGSYANPGKVANAYHALFKAHAKIDSINQLNHAIDVGAQFQVGRGFLDRNLHVAKSQCLAAFTFAQETGRPADGGTAHTCNVYLSRVRRFYQPNLGLHITLPSLNHYNLST